MRVRSRAGMASALLALCGTLGCGDASQSSQDPQGAPSYDEVRADFDEYLSAHDDCERSDDCVLISPGCPLGCFQAVNAAHASAVEAQARQLIAAFESDGLSCVYKCIAPQGAICHNRHCVRGSDLDGGQSGRNDASP